MAIARGEQLGSAVLCTPFPRSSRLAGDADRLEREIRWITAAAESAGFRLEAVQDLYDSSEQIVDRICDAIRDADLVVVIVNEKNPNVFFEAGFGLGIGKPLFYLAREGVDLPFDISGIECFTASELDEETCQRASAAISKCYLAGQKNFMGSSAFGQMQARLANLQSGDSLFSHCQRHAFDELVEWVKSWTDKSLEVVGPAGVLDMGCFIVGQLKKGGFATSYYSGHTSWRYSESNGLAPDYFAATRMAVKRGATVTRVYVVDRLEQVEEEAFRQRAWADASAGITIKYVLTRELPDPHARDFGIWDDALLGEVHYDAREGSPPVLQRCQYWGDRRHVDRAREWQQRIERLARPCPDLPSEAVLLQESAPSSLRGDCRDANLLGVDCTDYHKAWQPLRLGNSVSTPKWHADFYSSAFNGWSEAIEAPGNRRPKILITGLADYGMLYWVAQGIDAQVRERCEFHVLDICETPLSSARWLKSRLHKCDPPLDLNLICRHEDVFDNSCDSGSFDLICSDAFITRFAQEAEKRNLMKEWMRLRAPDGWIVTTARIRHGQHDIREVDREAFAARVENSVAGLRPDLKAFAQKAASSYARYIQSAPFQSEAAIREFLAATLPAGVGYQVSFAAIAEQEMVTANYAYILIGQELTQE